MVCAEGQRDWRRGVIQEVGVCHADGSELGNQTPVGPKHEARQEDCGEDGGRT